MKNNIIFALFGGMLGFGIGYLVANKKCKQEIDELSDAVDALVEEINYMTIPTSENPEEVETSDECEECKINFEPVVDASVVGAAVVEPVIELVSEKSQSKKQAKAKQERKENKYSIKHIDYDPLDEKYPDEEDEDIYIDRPSEPIPEPYTISYDEFANEHLDYEKKSVKYYPESDVLVYVDEDECILEDEYLFGPDWREKIGEYIRDMEFVRNENLSMDFEISIEHGPYPGEFDQEG